MNNKQDNKKTNRPTLPTEERVAKEYRRRPQKAEVERPVVPKAPSVSKNAAVKDTGRRRSIRRAQEGALTQNSELQNLVRYKGSLDKVFLGLVLILICFGSVMVFSASYAYSMAQDPGNGFIYVKKQIGFVLFGLLVMFVVSKMDTEFIRRMSPWAYWVSMFLLVLVFFIGSVGGGAKRWLNLGLFSVQPSEIAKTTLVLMLALYMNDHSSEIYDSPDPKERIKYGIFKPFLYIALACVLVIIEKHLSGTIILFMIGIIVIWAGGASTKFLAAAGGIGATLLAAVAFLVPYTRRRLEIWMDPEKDLTGSGWQTIQGLRAIGSGGLFGLGPANSRQKHMYVSQPQNDFIYSILCEELGYIGAIAVVLLFVALVVRGYKIASKAPDPFCSLVVTGIVSKVALQAFLNIAVVTNTLPNTGISLPFFSYGGSSTVVLLAEMGIVLSISRYSRQER